MNILSNIIIDRDMPWEIQSCGRPSIISVACHAKYSLSMDSHNRVYKKQFEVIPNLFSVSILETDCFVSLKTTNDRNVIS